MYTCPMHPDIRRVKPGRCPKCGMKLVLAGSGASTNMEHQHGTGMDQTTWESYVPLIAIITVIILAAWFFASRNNHYGPAFTFAATEDFMIGFFLVFSAFKLFNLKGFAAGYATYDLLAQRWFAYGYIYPFIELGFGLAMVAGYLSPALLWAELIVMALSGLGVLRKLLRHEKFQCVCLGTFLKVPLTKVTLIEDFGMAALALFLIIRW